jgi:hypothetical protein
MRPLIEKPEPLSSNESPSMSNTTRPLVTTMGSATAAMLQATPKSAKSEILAARIWTFLVKRQLTLRPRRQ